MISLLCNIQTNAILVQDGTNMAKQMDVISNALDLSSMHVVVPGE